MGAAASRRRLERRQRGRAGGPDDARGRWHRHVRLAADPVRVLRHEHDQANPWPDPDRRHHPARAVARPRRTDGAHDRRLRGAARRDGRRRCAVQPADAAAGTDRRAAAERSRRPPPARGGDDRTDQPNARGDDRRSHRVGIRRCSASMHRARGKGAVAGRAVEARLGRSERGAADRGVGLPRSARVAA